jgi:hypothetical protein
MREDKERAIQLRRKGMTYNGISNILDIPKNREKCLIKYLFRAKFVAESRGGAL